MARQKKGGRPPALTAAQRRKARVLRARGYAVARIARELECSRRTVERVLAAAPKPPAVPAPPPGAPTAPDPAAPGGSLIARVRELYAVIQGAREGLPPDAELAGKLAVDAVNVAALLARLESKARARGVRMSRAEIDAARRSLVERARAAIEQARADGRLVCADCGAAVVVAPIEDPPPVWRPQAAAPPPSAAEEPDESDDLAASFGEYFEALRSLASAAADAGAQQKYLRQAGRLAALLARCERHVDDEVAFDANTIAQGEAFVSTTIAAIRNRPRLLCPACSRRESIDLGEAREKGAAS